MQNVTEYQVAKAETSEGITNIVNQLISDQWQPIEGVRIITEIDEDGRHLISFYQTMIKF